MLDKDFWTTVSVIAGGIRASLTCISNLIKVLNTKKATVKATS